jgi:hypothetical protein
LVVGLLDFRMRWVGFLQSKTSDCTGLAFNSHKHLIKSGSRAISRLKPNRAEKIVFTRTACA